MLTGKCKENFESYLLKNVYESHYKGDDIYNHPKEQYFELFYSLPFSMQYGVYVDFFLSEFEMLLTIDWFENGEFEDVLISAMFPEYTDDGMPLHKTLRDAQQASINKANEIYNETFKTDKG